MWPIDVPEEIRVVLDKLVAAGHEAYFVGGSVRDAIIGVAPHDWDICTSATPEEVQSALAEFKVIETGLMPRCTSAQCATETARFIKQKSLKVA